MEFNLEHKSNPNKDKYKKGDIDIVYKFAKDVAKEFGSFVKTIALFGSTARANKESNDIDILIVVDDVTVNITN